MHGRGAIVAPAGCSITTPAALGAAASGANAAAHHYALEPAGTPRGELVVFLNASLSTPAAQLADPSTNLYSALAADGFHVVALAVWSNMGLDAAHQHDDAQTCPGATAHTAPIQCTVNAPRWTPLFE